MNDESTVCAGIKADMPVALPVFCFSVLLLTYFCVGRQLLLHNSERLQFCVEIYYACLKVFALWHVQNLSE